MTVGDTPPANVTILSFEVTVLSAVLQPGNVSLVSAPLKIEIKQLEVETAFLSTVNVPAGTYSSIALRLQNPEITFKNDTGATLPSPLNCANGAICEFKPVLTAPVTYSGAPFPLTVTANSPIGLLVDVNLANILNGSLAVDFTANGGVVVSQLPAQQGTGQLEDMDDVSGKVTAKDTANNQFTLQTPLGSLTIKVDSSTVFEEFDKLSTPCTAIPQNFTCVQVGQIVEADLSLVAGGTLLAKKVEAEDDGQNAEELEGLITGNITPAGFDMVLVDEFPDIAGVDVGNLVHINFVGFSFRVDAENLPVGGLSFSSATDLMVGQRVEVKRQGSVSAGTPPAIDANRVTLKKTTFTAQVKQKLANGTDFLVDNLPSLFTTASPVPVTEIEVRTSAQTGFDNVTDVAALN
ncbi:MAG TPA: DUF5666 domain-containing protein, partial [Candidatus Acidoferrales bacterium]|nr:DUF5666 domain-containing protein [Candidatus Acidoferrales bacterium]